MISPSWLFWLGFSSATPCRTSTPCAFRTSPVKFSFPCLVPENLTLGHAPRSCQQTKACRKDCHPRCLSYLPPTLPRYRKVSDQATTIDWLVVPGPMPPFRLCLVLPSWFASSSLHRLFSSCFTFRSLFHDDIWVIISLCSRLLMNLKLLRFTGFSSFIILLLELPFADSLTSSNTLCTECFSELLLFLRFRFLPAFQPHTKSQWCQQTTH